MVAAIIKCVAIGLFVIGSIHAKPGDVIPNHPNCSESTEWIPTYFVHPTNCSRFYECRQTDAWEFECSAGLHFNSKINVCDFPANAQCVPQLPGQSTTTTTSPTTVTSNTTNHPPATTESPTTSPLPVTTETPATSPSPVTTETPPAPITTTTSSTSTLPPSTETTQVWPEVTTETPDPRCPPLGATQPSYWADRSDCTKYIGCLEGCKEKFTCPQGLYWNDSLKRCDSASIKQCPCPVIPPAPNDWDSVATTTML
ncbi:probable chitinase 10 [Anopheles nili]|uniref:probable chitinase 10 n=1 Tax=Anopheles nili TaxID=185578 RepID=UPI00237B4F8A|nr:probable chitinase 10 [Anopheles nili]